MTMKNILLASGVTLGAAALLSLLDRRLYAKDNLHVLLTRLLAGARTEVLTRCKSIEDVQALRKKMDNNQADKLAAIARSLGFKRETLQVPVDGGEIDVRVFTPVASSGDLPLVIWFHGGGMCTGWADDVANIPELLLTHFQNRAIVASVDYRMAPEHTFPTGAEDAIAATRWLQAHSKELGADPQRVSVAGMSAGGYLASVVHQAARDRGFPLHSAVLMEPMLRRGGVTRSYIENGRGFGLTAETMAWFWMQYCPDPTDAADPRCEPVRGVGDGNLAPCIVTTSEYDPLRDEGVEYYKALSVAGVDVTHLRFRTTHVGPLCDTEQLQALQRQWSALLSSPAGKL